MFSAAAAADASIDWDAFTMFVFNFAAAVSSNISGHLSGGALCVRHNEFVTVCAVTISLPNDVWTMLPACCWPEKLGWRAKNGVRRRHHHHHQLTRL